jgi:hypothetical protein
MTQPRKPGREPRLHELLSDEIGRLVMRADRVERHEIEALVSRVKAPRSERVPRAMQSRKTERVA